MRVLETATIAAALCLSATATVAAPAFDWSGFYVGGHAGGDWSRSRIDDFSDSVQQFSGPFVPGRGIVIVPGTTTASVGGTLKRSGAFAGGQIGFAGQSENWVFGVEGDVDTATKSVSDSESDTIPTTLLSPAGSLIVERSVKSGVRWSARARLGYAWDRAQIYVTGGVAGARLTVSGQDTLTYPTGGAAASAPQVFTTGVANITAGSVRDSRVGWTAGGGAEVGLTDKISVGLEFRHTNLGSASYALPTSDVSVTVPTITAPVGSTTVGATPPKAILSTARMRFTDEALSARINFRF